MTQLNDEVSKTPVGDVFLSKSAILVTTAGGSAQMHTSRKGLNWDWQWGVETEEKNLPTSVNLA